jgi:hypothetical protein
MGRVARLRSVRAITPSWLQKRPRGCRFVGRVFGFPLGAEFQKVGQESNKIGAFLLGTKFPLRTYDEIGSSFSPQKRPKCVRVQETRATCVELTWVK